MRTDTKTPPIGRVLVILRPGLGAFQPAALVMLAGSLFFAIQFILTKKLTSTESPLAVLQPKLKHIEQTNATLVATGNPGCHMQIGAGLKRSGSNARTVHPVDLLDASYARKFGADPR